MDKTVVSLMCENIKKLSVDIDEMVRNDANQAVDFIHDQYYYAQCELNLHLFDDLKLETQL